MPARLAHNPTHFVPAYAEPRSSDPHRPAKGGGVEKSRSGRSILPKSRWALTHSTKDTAALPAAESEEKDTPPLNPPHHLVHSHSSLGLSDLEIAVDSDRHGSG